MTSLDVPATLDDEGALPVMHRLRSHELLWREVDDEIVILDLRRSVYASVNQSGRTLWLRLARGATSEDLAQELRSVYGREADVARQDAEAFLETVREQGLLA